MSDEQDPQQAAAAALEREIRDERKFTLAEAIGRLAGPGAMKGQSPVAQMQQAQFAIESWLAAHLGRGPLQLVLHRDVAQSEQLLNNIDKPLVVLAQHCQRVLETDYLLTELVREADVEWGRSMGERPYFEKEGLPPHTDDPFTVSSVRDCLTTLLSQLADEVTPA